VRRKQRDAAERDADLAEHCEKVRKVSGQPRGGAADAVKCGHQSVRSSRRCPRLQVDCVQLIDQPAITRRQASDLRRLAVAVRSPDQPLQEPCADGVKGFDTRHVEEDALCIGDLRRG
jgi:hypothetical protein